MKPISKLTEEELKRWFDVVKEVTNNFSDFDPRILMQSPQYILMFSLVLGFDHKFLQGCRTKIPELYELGSIWSFK
ncbi:MAG: hypothetical protein QMD36_02315 [Candidatus Aenigmarchaeota archaeon]|nr:hypothetical protein [Candidatus Aenigmarchaeota archaeon]